MTFLIDTSVKFSKTFISGQKLFETINKTRPGNFDKDFSDWQNNFSSFKKRLLWTNKITKNYFASKYKFEKYLNLIEKITIILPDILGKGGRKTYFVLLQNNMELRPSGGFMGSYAKLKFENGILNDILIQDIYVPDGQIIGHVDPPWPIQEAFKQGWWRLRDANWDPDFPSAAKVIDWFFQKGKEEKADGIFAVNLITAKKILKIIGPLFLIDYNQTVDSENLYQVIQSYSEINFFPGSTQKRDILSAVGRAFFEEIKRLKPKEILEILKIVYQGLEERQILLAFFDNYLAKTFKELGWDGSMKQLKPSTENLFSDYTYIVEANLGANKANCCVEREVYQNVDFSKNGILAKKIKIHFKNIGNFRQGIPPFFWGGDYNNFLRIFYPNGFEIKKVSIDEIEVPKEKISREEKINLGIKGIGFFVNIPVQKERKIEINFEISYGGVPKYYNLFIQKQPGIEATKFMLKLINQKEEKIVEKEIFKDEEINLKN